MKKNIILFVSMVIITLFAVLCTGIDKNQAQNDMSLLTLDRIFSGRDFSAERFGPARWLEDGSGYTTLEKSQTLGIGRDIVRYDPETGRREILISAERLVPPGENEPLRIDNYIWAQDGKKLLVYTNSRRVWRQNTRGDYWVLDIETWKLQKLGGAADPSTLMFAKFSPDGSQVGYVMKNNIYVEDLATQRIIPLTSDGTETLINGTFDWVYEEELGLRDGFRWSPDGKHIAYWQLDSSGIKEFYLINNTDSLYPKITAIRYPKVGTDNSVCRVGVVSASGGETRWFQFSGDSRRDYYIARMGWANSSEEIILQHLNRLQNTNTVMLGNIRTGELRPVFIDADKTWVEVVSENDLRWISGGKYFTWISERDGWQHVYVVSRDGKDVRCVTPGDFDVISIQNIDVEGGWIYFIASPDNPTQRFLYRARLDGEGNIERVTPEGSPGSNRYQISPDGRWAIHNFSSFGAAPKIDLVELPGHHVLRPLVDNKKLRTNVENLERGEFEFFRVDIGDVELDGWMMKPPDFDPGKKYPLLFHIYGEPAGSTVRDSWGGRNYLWHLMLTQRGYLVASLDNRGTNVPRGRDWRKSIYGQVGILAAKDQAAALRRLLKDRPYFDPNRIGIWGWSGGGQMSLNMIFRYPELYSTAMAIAFVSDQRLYDTIYQERYMGLPDNNEEGYINGSPITHAHRLEGNLLIVHGTADDNVHYQSFERLINELVKHNKPFTIMSYPNRTHGISEGENTTRHLFSLLTRYLMSNMPPGPQSP
jgi:dipeptidyl-peptidase-4